ncbi:hypothetical protein ACIRST_38300 [Kitasatospora sp. NPDC101447]|uniref:hypothetical protein n=1 Tax=Kitasatospora sp. NPDC101447 TaxID=3364102 RepID=UPI003828BDB4
MTVAVKPGEGPWAGCGNAGLLHEDQLLFADAAGAARFCAATGCTGQPWNQGRGAPPTYR